MSNSYSNRYSLKKINARGAKSQSPSRLNFLNIHLKPLQYSKPLVPSKKTLELPEILFTPILPRSNITKQIEDRSFIYEREIKKFLQKSLTPKPNKVKIKELNLGKNYYKNLESLAQKKNFEKSLNDIEIEEMKLKKSISLLSKQKIAAILKFQKKIGKRIITKGRSTEPTPLSKKSQTQKYVKKPLGTILRK